jgi:hypothetical protein
MPATIPAPPLLGLYYVDGSDHSIFPGPPSSWPSGPTTNLAAEYFAMDSDDQFNTFGLPFLQKCYTNGITPYVEIEPWDYDQSPVPLADITSGKWDTYFQQVGQAIASAGKTTILTWGHEFNVSGQYPWAYNAAESGLTGSGPGGATLTPAQWQTGWKYAHDKVNQFANGWALWMWAPGANTGGSSTTSPVPWWPGASYVDMVGVDGYEGLGGGPTTFNGVFSSIMSDIRGTLGWSAPVFVAETSLTNMVEQGGDSITTFVTDMFNAGMSGILEFEDGFTNMTSAQWNEYNTAVASHDWSTLGGGSNPGGGGTGGTLNVTVGTPDEVNTSNGVAHSFSAVNPPAGSMVRWCVAWLNSNDTLGFTFTAQDSTGVSYGAPTHTGSPGDGDGGCYLLIWDHTYTAAPGPITLTVTASGSGLSGAAPSDCLILPYVITGQAADQSTAAFNQFSEVGDSTTTYELALTTTVPGSVVFVLGAPNHNLGLTGPVTPIASTVTDVDWDDANVGSRGTFGRGKNPTGTPGSMTFGWTSAGPSDNGYGIVLSEVIPASSDGGSNPGGGGTNPPPPRIGATLWYDTAVTTGLDAKAALLSGGTLQVYTGDQPGLNGSLTGTLLVTLTFGSPAFAGAVASGGIATAFANPIASGVAVASGTPGYYALVTSSGQTVLTGSVGDGSVSGSSLTIPGLSIAAGATIGCSAFSLTQSESGN